MPRVSKNRAGNWIVTAHGGKTYSHGPGASGRAAAQRQARALRRTTAKRAKRARKR